MHVDVCDVWFTHACHAFLTLWFIVRAGQLPGGMTEAQAASHVALPMALTSRAPHLLQHLLCSYGTAAPVCQAAIEKFVASLARALGPQSSQLHAAIMDPPPGSLRMLLQIVTVLCDAMPPTELVAACLQHYHSTGSECEAWCVCQV